MYRTPFQLVDSRGSMGQLSEVKWITESRGKTDRVDAKKLAELARADLLPRAVHVVEGPVRELQEVVSAR